MNRICYTVKLLVHKHFVFGLGLFLALASVMVVGMNNPATAQDQEYRGHKGLKYRKFRVTFITPIGTNGLESPDYSARYSFNILAGYNGALEGAELGGLLNINRRFAQGVQVAGLANVSGEETEGIQISGLLNYSGEDMDGIQFTGGVNYAADMVQGIQASGLANMSGGDMEGLIFAGAANIAFGDMSGILASGAMNVARDQMEGLMFAGGLNYSNSFEGIQAAAINVSDRMQGIQFGVFNASKEAEGIQIGLINYGEEFEGMPAGVISYYSNGRHNVDIWGDEMGFTNIGLKLGTYQVYNMVSFGYNPALSGDVWQVGWTIGQHHDFGSYWIDTDLSWHHINRKYWTDRINNRYTYRVLFGTPLARNLHIYGGPTLNMLVSRTDDFSDYVPYSFYDAGVHNRQYRFWVGATVGLQLFDTGEIW